MEFKPGDRVRLIWEPHPEGKVQGPSDNQDGLEDWLYVPWDNGQLQSWHEEDLARLVD